MKKLVIIMLVLFFTVGLAYAEVTFEIKGTYDVRGTYMDNADGVNGSGYNYVYYPHPTPNPFNGSDLGGLPIAAMTTATVNEEAPEPYSFYDQELDLDIKMSVTDKTFIFINLEARDQDWLQGNTDDAVVVAGADQDDTLEIKRLFGSHTFGKSTRFDFGLMTGSAWGTSFGDNADGKWRLVLRQPTSVGLFAFVVEKNQEVGSVSSTADYTAEKDDSDAYYIGYVTKLGPVYVKPLVGLVYNGELTGGDPDNPYAIDGGNEHADQTVKVLLLSADGQIGMFGFEGEFDYQSVTFDVDDPNLTFEDTNIYGVYFKGWADLDAFKVGGLFAYGSYDDEGGLNGGGQGFGFGFDFTPTIFGADQATVGSSSKSEYYAVTLYQLFAEYAMNDSMSFSASYTMWSSNEKDSDWEDATGTEFDAGFNYKISDAVSYTIALGTGTWDFDSSSLYKDADSFTRAYHMITIEF
jgi:hypothetical protein